jgi:hypothetical protein
MPKLCLALRLAFLSLLAPLAAAGNFDGCGQIVPGVTCPKLFGPDSGGLYILTTDLSAWNVGDRVHVVGPIDPGCITICQQGQGCINPIVLESCDVGDTFCFGDDLDPDVVTDCPCGNFGDPGHGCGNSVSTGGALLTATGTISPDWLNFTVVDIPPTSASIYLQGDFILAAGVVFGDGVRCAGGNLIRLGLKVDDDGDGSTSYGPDFFDTQVSVAGSVIAGNTYAYQTYYRNPAPAWCPPATFNVSQAIKITW